MGVGVVEVGVAEEEGECREVGCIATILDTVIIMVFTPHSRLVGRGKRRGRRRLAPTWRLPAPWRWSPRQPGTAILFLTTFTNYRLFFKSFYCIKQIYLSWLWLQKCVCVCVCVCVCMYECPCPTPVQAG